MFCVVLPVRSNLLQKAASRVHLGAHLHLRLSAFSFGLRVSVSGCHASRACGTWKVPDDELHHVGDGVCWDLPRQKRVLVDNTRPCRGAELAQDGIWKCAYDEWHTASMNVPPGTVCTLPQVPVLVEQRVDHFLVIGDPDFALDKLRVWKEGIDGLRWWLSRNDDTRLARE